MELTLKRIAKKSTYTIGHLYANGNYIADVIEDKDRGLTDSMSVAEITKKKVYGETAIPTGTYNVRMDIKSPKYSNYTKYPWAKQFGGILPRLENVKGYDGILMHVGNTAKDTYGCLIIGQNKEVGRVINSTATFTKFMNEYMIPAKKHKEKITITIQ